MTTLMQAHRQWMSRAPDERFTSLIDMQDFKRRVRENSRSQVVSSRVLTLRPISEDDPRETGLALTGHGQNELTGAAMSHWSYFHQDRTLCKALAEIDSRRPDRRVGG